MLDVAGMSKAGIERKATCRALFSKLLFLSEAEELFPENSAAATAMIDVPGVFGATDELGYYAVDKPLTVYDFWATILHQLGIDHEKLTYRFGGRDFRLTDVHGSVVRDIVA